MRRRGFRFVAPVDLSDSEQGAPKRVAEETRPTRHGLAFVGRERELQRLAEALDDANQGLNGRALALMADPQLDNARAQAFGQDVQNTRAAVQAALAEPERLRDAAEAWRPWRAYAAMHLWTAARA